jgi:anti-anti-sigma factor
MNASIPQVNVTGSGEEITLVINGNILSTNVQEVRQRVLDILTQNETSNPSWKKLHMDLTSAQMIDSTGLNFLVAVTRHVKKRGIDLKISVTSPNISKSFSFIRLNRQAEIVLVEGGSN